MAFCLRKEKVTISDCAEYFGSMPITDILYGVACDGNVVGC